MNVLLVDDQINVINGMIAGINWKKLSVEEISKAYNAEEAKTIIQSHKIDILLCDIEMPGENGLKLFEWVKGYNSDIECIFLTAHADFLYAKEALKLGGFDYILQPAKYEDIESAIMRANQKIISKSELKRYSVYGKSLFEEKDRLIEGILKNYLSGQETKISNVIQRLEAVQIFWNESTMIYNIQIQILKLHSGGEQFTSELLRYAFGNVLEELFRINDCKTIVVQLDINDYVVLVYSNQNQPVGLNEIKNTLSYFSNVCSESLGCDVACYTSNAVTLEELSVRSVELMRLKRDNVAMKSGIFLVQKNSIYHDNSYATIDMHQWQQYLVGGNTELFRECVCNYLNEEKLNLFILKQFYQEFMYMLAGACEEIGITVYQLFKDKDIFEKSLVCYQSIKSMREMIDYIADYFKEATSNKDVNYVEMMIQYINRNIEKDLRRSDIAAMLNLNEDYISRIFKKEVGISLKEFIISEKMKVARNLLRNTTFSIGVIATKVGFSNFSYFTQLYKKTMGRTPAEDRDTQITK